ncbi:unnamed protein product [Amoebophrya sp. A25]|nr:unnamed protein product [Amoebophrya sp. A25]|eukprot:GSA25T00005759001.1
MVRRKNKAKGNENKDTDEDDDDDRVGGHDTGGTGSIAMDRGTLKLTKICVHCRRPFSWRKKWERCWDEVLTCSNACKRERKQQQQQQSRGGNTFGVVADASAPQEKEENGDIPVDCAVEAEGNVSGSCEKQAPATEAPEESSEAPRDLSVPAKLPDHEQAVQTQSGPKHATVPASTKHSAVSTRAKECAVCGEAVLLAYRCRWDKSKIWRFVCRPCWPNISNVEYLESMAAERRRKKNAAETGAHHETKSSAGPAGEELPRAETTPFTPPPRNKKRGKNADSSQHDDGSSGLAALVQTLRNEGGGSSGGLGNPYYVYGGTWKATIGLTKAELADLAKQRVPAYENSVGRP